MTIEQECKDAEDARRERRVGQSKGDRLWKEYRGRVDSIASLRARREGQSFPASTYKKEK